MTERKIELRKITYNARLSEETCAYAADLYVDGRLLAHVSNNGHGGSDMQRPANGRTYDEIQELDSWIKATYPKREAFGMVLEPDLESVCGDLLDDHLVTRDLTRILKRTVAYYDPGKKCVYTLKGKIEGAARAQAITDIVRKNPSAKVLNNLPFAEALVLFRSAA